MKKIKFRATAYASSDGKKIKPQIVYGCLRINEEGDFASISTFKDKNGATFTYFVEPESVAQFVGYDADGKEVYEGDICHCEELGDCHIVLSGYSVPGYLPLTSKEIEWHLKEGGKNENLS